MQVFATLLLHIFSLQIHITECQNDMDNEKKYPLFGIIIAGGLSCFGGPGARVHHTGV